MYQFSSQQMFLKTRYGEYLNLLHIAKIDRGEDNMKSIYAHFNDGEMILIASFQTEEEAIEYMDNLFK